MIEIMTKSKKEKSCMFYVSDYHFEMIGLLNIKKEIKENKKIVIITENNLEESIKILLSRVTFELEEKNKIESLNWKNENKEKYRELEKVVKEGCDVSIYIKGKEEYIEKQNKKIEELIKTNKEKVNIIDCYNFLEVRNKSNEILKKYETNLVTGKKMIL